MWLFLARSACSSAASSPPTCSTRTRPSSGPTPARALRHPLHVGQLVRAADELAHDGAGRRRPSSGATTTGCGSGSSPPRCSARSSSPARSTSSPSFYSEGLGYTTNLFVSAFYTLTGFHGVHVTRRHHHAAVAVAAVAAGPHPAAPGRDRRDRRPLLALRRHRVDRDLHRRLPDPRTEEPTSSPRPPTPRAHRPSIAIDAGSPMQRHEHEPPRDVYYVRIAIVLAVLTGHRGRPSTYLEHRRRGDRRSPCCSSSWRSSSAWSPRTSCTSSSTTSSSPALLCGLFLAVAVYIVALASLQVFCVDLTRMRVGRRRPT